MTPRYRCIVSALCAALAAAASTAHAQTAPVLTVLAGRGGTGGCLLPLILPPPTVTTFLVDPVSSPAGVAVDPTGRLFVSSTAANCVYRLDADGLVRAGGLSSGPFKIGTGTAGFSDALPSGDAAAALLSGPQGLAADTAGNLYIVDSNNARIRKVDTVHWTISTIAGGGSLRPLDGMAATDASFLFPRGVAVDKLGNVYFADSNLQKVFKVDTNGVLTKIAGSGGSSYDGEGGPAITAAMIPMGVAVDDAGNVFIADWSNSIIRKVDTQGIITTVAGNPFNTSGLGDGLPAAFGARLNRPRGVAVDKAGNLYIADTDNSRIRKVDTTGIINTIAGTGTPGFLDTQVNVPTSVAVDNLGNVYIADTGNNQLRALILTPRTYALTLTNAGTGSGSLGGGAVYSAGQVATVTAVPNPTSTFDGWSGPNASECATGTVLMNGDKSCTATFTQQAVCAADVTTSVSVARSGFSYNLITKRYGQTVTLTNTGTATLTGPLFLVLDSLSSAATLLGTSGKTSCAPPAGSPFVTIAGGLSPGARATVNLQFTDPTNAAIAYVIRVLSGGGTGQP